MSDDPTETNPDLYKVVFENERVRVLEYRDVPGDRTTSHSHPDSVMVTLSAFDRKLVMGDQERDVSLDGRSSATGCLRRRTWARTSARRPRTRSSSS